MSKKRVNFTRDPERAYLKFSYRFIALMHPGRGRNVTADAMSALPPKRTNGRCLDMSALCQSRLNAPQQNASLFDHLVGDGLQRQGHGRAALERRRRLTAVSSN